MMDDNHRAAIGRVIDAQGVIGFLRLAREAMDERAAPPPQDPPGPPPTRAERQRYLAYTAVSEIDAAIDSLVREQRG